MPLIPSPSRKVRLVIVLMITAVAVACAHTLVPTTTDATAATAGTQDPLSVRPFYVQNDTPAEQSLNYYRHHHDKDDARLMQRIASQPQAIWLNTGASIRWMGADLSRARSHHRLPVFVLYDIPYRDCGSYSSGGARSASAYEAFVRHVASHLGRIPTAVIVEPDALGEITCLSSAEQASRYSLIRFAAKTLVARPHTTVYLDAGNAAWLPVHTAAARLRRAGVGLVRGFSLNVSSFVKTAKTISYGTRIAHALGGKHFVIDTSRNGRGARYQRGSIEWCNPPGRGVGLDPTTRTASPLVDAYLWVKSPGESDGQCNGGPAPGVWWPAYALGLASRAERG